MKFEEEFPELKGFQFLEGDEIKAFSPAAVRTVIEAHCLSKSKVREAINKRLVLGTPEVLVIALNKLLKELE